jgi:glycosyltransferase involved in cell wall biosynthesis
MLLSNPFEPDARVLKEANSLSQNGFSITILAWDRERKYKKVESINGISVERCQFKGGYGRGMSSLIDILFFYCFIIVKLFAKNRIEIVHCHDLDTLLIGFIISRLRGCKVIYDAHEVEYFISFPSFLRMEFKKVERCISKRVDAILIVNGIQREQFFGFVANRDIVTEIRNCPTNDFLNSIGEKSNQNRSIVIGYIGNIQNGTGIEKAIEAFDILCENFNELELLLVGKIHPKFKTILGNCLQRSRNSKKIKIIGAVPFTEVIRYYHQICISFIFYDTNSFLKFNSPVKLFESMAVGIPVLCTRVGDVEEIIKESQCGFLVDADDMTDIIDKLSILIQDESQRKKMGTNGHRYAKEKLNWETMEKRLLMVYQKLL